MKNTLLSTWLARAALAFCFLGFGIWELMSPNLWTTYLPEFAQGASYAKTLILAHGAVLSILALGVLSGYAARLFTTLSVLAMLEVCIEIFIQEGFSDVFIRDGSILLFACALAASAWACKSSGAGSSK